MPSTISLTTLFLGATVALQTALSIESNENDVSWQIRANGIGYFNRPDVTYDEAKTLYPNAEISVELGNPTTMWRKNFLDNSKTYFFVFRQRGQELFRAQCDCTPLSDSDWKPFYSSPKFNKNEIILHPIATNPTFSTDRGIRVGKTVSELRHAYPEFRRLTAVIQTIPSMPGETYEFLCFDGQIVDSSINSMHSMNFYIRPAPGKQRAGKYKNKEFTTKIDSDAIIVGIQPHGGCLLNAVSLD